MLSGDDRENFAVQLDIGFLKLGDKLGIACAGFFGGSADFGVPESAEGALFLLAVSELVCPCMQ